MTPCHHDRISCHSGQRPLQLQRPLGRKRRLSQQVGSQTYFFILPIHTYFLVSETSVHVHFQRLQFVSIHWLRENECLWPNLINSLGMVWTRKRKTLAFGAGVAFILLVIIIAAAAKHKSSAGKFPARSKAIIKDQGETYIQNVFWNKPWNIKKTDCKECSQN